MLAYCGSSFQDDLVGAAHVIGGSDSAGKGNGLHGLCQVWT